MKLNIIEYKELYKEAIIRVGNFTDTELEDFVKGKSEIEEQKTEKANFPNLLFLESEEFYNLMQQYRIAPMENQELVSTCFERIKTWLRKYCQLKN